MAGKLYIVPTPVGNLEDMTLRAVKVLQEADLILAEDTRTSSVLLKHYDIHKPLQSHHKFNEHQTVQLVKERILAGLNVALISDAGTPGISDPGFLLAGPVPKKASRFRPFRAPRPASPPSFPAAFPATASPSRVSCRRRKAGRHTSRNWPGNRAPWCFTKARTGW